MYPRLFQFGSLAIPTTGVFTAIAILAALVTARATARRLRLDPEPVWDLGVAGVITSLLAPRLILIVTNWSDFLAHPLWMLGLIGVRSQAAVAGGLALAVAAMVLYAKSARLPLRCTLDALAPSFALGLSIVAIGNFAGGSNFGSATSLPWAITYTRRLASLWYQTPLGTPLHPVQLYSAFAELCILAILVAMLAKQDTLRIRPGEMMGAWMFLHAVTTFLFNCLRGDLDTHSFLLSQALEVCLVAVGGMLWFF